MKIEKYQFKRMKERKDGNDVEVKIISKSKKLSETYNKEKYIKTERDTQKKK